jgi:hypothetical protein
MAMLDPRLANSELLALAALRVQARRQTPPEPRRTVTLRVVYYDVAGVEPPLDGPTYVLDLPAMPR